MSTVRRVEINTDVYWVCEDHAFSTEREEIMGLLMGDINEDNVVEISAIKMLERSDKRKDRVEISTEQLVEATVEADQLTSQLDRTVRVVGWYHSHPHITVLPSAVDCRTQASYQQMDNRFVGLIFSVFPGDGVNNETQNLKVICFQSSGEPPQCVEVDLEIVPKLGVQEIFQKSFLDLPNILFKEETEQYRKQFENTKLSDLSKFHNDSVYNSSMYHIMSVIDAPTIETLDMRNQIMEHQIGVVEARKQDLIKQKNSSKAETKTSPSTSNHK